MPKKNSHGCLFTLLLNCPCGRKHRVYLARGEAQVIWRATCNGKLPLDFKVRHVILKPTGRTLENGQREYVQEIPQSE
jgi:hypothetical protein